jgi:metal-responsive CopG/Arc/MetJ family transcriptional regulator
MRAGTRTEVHFALRNSLLAKIDAIAEYEGTTRAAVIRTALRRYADAYVRSDDSQDFGKKSSGTE